MKRKDRGDNLIIFCLMLLAILLLLWGMKRTAYAEIGEVTFEPIPKEEQVNTEITEMPGHTHDVKCIDLTYEEAQLLMQIAEAEAGNQGEEGMFFVMCTVINRTRKSGYGWPSSIKSVIYQKDQYYTEGIGKTPITPEAHEALARIEKGEVAPEIVAFETKDSKKLEQYFDAAFPYRDHIFYTVKK